MKEVKVFLNTWGNYIENGAEGGRWVSLPMEESELKATMAAIAEKMGDNSPEWFINDFESCQDLPGLDIGEYADIFKPNSTLNELNDLDPEDFEKLAAIMEVITDDLKDALDSMDNYEFYEGATLEEMAEEWAESFDIPDALAGYINYEAIARDFGFNGDHETKNGVLCAC